MNGTDGETVSFGERAEPAADEVGGHAVHRPGYVEAPAQIADAEAADDEGATRPQILNLTQE